MQAEAQARFRAHVENPKDGKALPSEYAVPVYKIVLKSGGKKEFDSVRRRSCFHGMGGRGRASKRAFQP